MATNDNRYSDRPRVTIRPIVNDTTVEAAVEPRLKLSDFLRREGWRSVRVGCEHGACGACSVLLDGELVKSCLLYAVQTDGASIETVEGLDSEGEESGLHPIQAAFDEADALQCGFCTSGFMMATKALLEDDPDPDRAAIEEGLRGNLCRCTGYQPIVRAVEASAERLDHGEAE